MISAFLGYGAILITLQFLAALHIGEFEVIGSDKDKSGLAKDAIVFHGNLLDLFPVEPDKETSISVEELFNTGSEELDIGAAVRTSRICRGRVSITFSYIQIKVGTANG